MARLKFFGGIYEYKPSDKVTYNNIAGRFWERWIVTADGSIFQGKIFAPEKTTRLEIVEKFEVVNP